MGLFADTKRLPESEEKKKAGLPFKAYQELKSTVHRDLLNKVDLLPHLDFDEEACLGHARMVNPRLEVIRTSARSGEGVAAWIAWILAQSAALAR